MISNPLAWGSENGPKSDRNSWARQQASEAAFNKGAPYHGSEAVEKGKLTGKTGMSDYFFFLCPKCADGQVLRILEYEFRTAAPAVERRERKTPKKFFDLALHVCCPNCEFEDFVKIDNNHPAGRLEDGF
jgi:rubredoxin